MIEIIEDALITSLPIQFYSLVLSSPFCVTDKDSLHHCNFAPSRFSLSQIFRDG